MLSLWRHPLSSDALVMTKVLKNKCWVKYRLWIIHRRCQVCGNQFKLPLAVHHTVYHMIRAFKQMDKWTTAWECPSHTVFPNKTIFKSEYKAVKAAMYLIKSWTMPIIWKLYSRQGLSVQKNSYKQITLLPPNGQHGSNIYLHTCNVFLDDNFLPVRELRKSRCFLQSCSSLYSLWNISGTEGLSSAQTLQKDRQQISVITTKQMCLEQIYHMIILY